ncbi:MAG: zf-HC2 domain-containing protein [Chloroflexota bacterium]
MRLPFRNPHPHNDISAYADGELAPARIPALEAHLASCAPCQNELEAMRVLQSQLASLPEIEAPRSFALTPEMAQRPVVAGPAPRIRQPSRVAAFSSGMRLAGAGMSLALVIVLVLNFSGGSSSDSGDNALVVTGANQPEANAFAASPGDASIPKSINDEPTPSAVSINDNGVSSPPAKTEDTQSTSGGAAVGASPAVAPDSLGVGGDPKVLSPAETPAPGGVVGAVPGSTIAQDTSNDGRNASAGEATAVPPHAANLDASQDTDSGSSIDTMLIIAIALAAGVVLAFAGSWMLQRLARDRS